MAKKEKNMLRQLIEDRGVKDLAGVKELVKALTSGLIQEIMDAELSDTLGYSKYDYKNKQTDKGKRTIWDSGSARQKAQSAGLVF